MVFTPKWTDAALQTAVSMWEAGERAEVISLALGGAYSHHSIRARMRRDNIGRKAKVKALARPKKAYIPEPPRQRTTYNVHPMWSMPEDERRLAFIKRFEEGRAATLAAEEKK